MKPVHFSKATQRWFQRHRQVSQERIGSIVRWSIHPPDSSQYELHEIIMVRGVPKRVTIWVHEYSWNYLVYKIHIEGQ